MIVVFGACGFVGTYLTAGINKKDFIAVDKKRAKNAEYVLSGDICDGEVFNFLPTKNIDCVINLASCQPANVSKENYDVSQYIKTNTIGTINILDYCVKNKIKKYIHVVSHRSVINQPTISSEGLDEEARYAIDYKNEFAEFAVSEMAAIEMINSCAAKYDIQHIILRVPAIFGYGPHTEGFQKGTYKKTGFQTFIENAIEGKDLEVWGFPNIARDIVYVKDVVSAIKKAIVSSASGLFNVSSGKLLSLDEEAITIAEYFGKGSRIVYKPKKQNNIEFCHYDISKAKECLGWKPRYANFRDMVADYDKERKNGRFDFLIEERRKNIK